MKANEDSVEQTLQIPDEIRIIPYNLSPSLISAYHEYAQSLSDVNFDPELLEKDWSDIGDEETFKRLVVLISLQSSVKTYRFLEKIEKEVEDQYQKNWVRLGLIHAQMLLEQSLMDTTIGFIVSGLGGEGKRLRYNVVIGSTEPITHSLAKAIHQECQSNDQSFDMVCENTFHFQPNYVQLQILVPFQQTPEKLIRLLIDRYDFLDKKYMESNMRFFEKDEIEKWLKTT